MNRISIVELPFNLGLRAPDGREPGVNKLPDWLKKHSRIEHYDTGSGPGSCWCVYTSFCTAFYGDL